MLVGTKTSAKATRVIEINTRQHLMPNIPKASNT